MSDKVYYFEEFNEVPDEVRSYIERGWTVYNAPRPLYGHTTWTGDFRHGVFFAAVAPDGHERDEFGDAPKFRQRNEELDGYTCEIVTKEAVMAYGAMMCEKHNINLADFTYEQIAKSYAGWLSRQ